MDRLLDEMRGSQQRQFEEIRKAQEEIKASIAILMRQMGAVLEAEQRRANNNARQKKCRGNKKQREQEERERYEATLSNNDVDDLLSNEYTDVCNRMTSTIKLYTCMSNHMEHVVGQGWKAWLRDRFALCESHEAVALLVRLYNTSCTRPWVKTRSNRYQILKHKTEKGKPDQWYYENQNGFLPLVDPPKEWSPEARQTFAETPFWTILALLYNFVTLVVNIDLNKNEDFKHLRRTFGCFGGTAGYEPLKGDDYGWEPKHVVKGGHKAHKALRELAPELKMIRKVFENEIRTPVSNITFYSWYKSLKQESEDDHLN